VVGVLILSTPISQSFLPILTSKLETTHMKLHHLSLLCDPETHEDLTLVDAIYDGDEVISGALVSPSHSYPITLGIPRFVSDEGYSDNFGYQWNRWARVQFEDQNIDGPMDGHTTRMFETITGFSADTLRGKTVLDMGCGPGRFTDVAVSMGASVVALDYSSAIDAAQANFAGKAADILFVQGDALRLPLKDNSVDVSFTIGVLHHTPSPATGVGEAQRVTREGGQFAIRVYNADDFYTFPTVRFWRGVCLKLKPFFGHYPPLIYSYFFGTLGFALGRIWRPLSYPLRAIFPTVWLPDYRWAILDTFDAIATTHQSGHTPDEVEGWLRATGFAKVRQRQGNDFVADK
jgi:SAM-dependent methyltransferase